jgi:hypothetical protein
VTTRFVLVPSPLLGSAVWEPVAAELRAAGHPATVAALDQAVRVPQDVVEAVLAALPDEPVILVPHSGAGLSAPLVADRAGLAATVFVDAALPPADAREATMASGPFADFLAEQADADGVLPVWTDWWDEDLAPLFPDATTRALVERQQRRLPLSYFTRPLRVPERWTERSAAYLAFGDTYADETALARDRGWPVTVLPGHHLEMLARPGRVAAEVARLAQAATR